MSGRQAGDGRPDRPARHPAEGAGASGSPAGGGGSRGRVAPTGAPSRGAVLDPEAEGRALAAFRSARDAGAHRAARTRRRDDWRPAGERRSRWSLRAALVTLAAGATLGGVAFASIGPGGAAAGDTRERGADRDTRRPSSSAPAQAGPTSVPAPLTASPSGAPDERRPTAGDTAAHCRAYSSVEGRGRALDSTAWRRLVRAAGGEEHVEEFCAGLPAAAGGKRDSGGGAPGEPSSSPGGKPAKGGKGAKGAKGVKGMEGAKGAGSPKGAKGT
ncbi:hypothetical protein GCM10010515_01620 [Streptomyces fructofermentans]|uniref:Uncharacterized protein n=1 Tax=Streptomyces fructofermentans TaxID=152141 RepID=A0A918JZ93_9ACTN|nr:hypothetical protein GCM10010515_01620 [Streptomyces fructofermentans]